MTTMRLAEPIPFPSPVAVPATGGMSLPQRVDNFPIEGEGMNDEGILAYWREYQAAEGCTVATIRERMIAVRALLRRTGLSLHTIDRRALIGDLARTTAAGRPLSPKTKQNYRSLYHTLFTWMQDEGLRADNPAARLPRTRVPTVEANPMATVDIERLLFSGIYAKTRLYVLLYAYQGFRCIEIAAVSGESIDWERQRIRSDEGKGGRVVWRPIHPIVWSELQKYPRTGYLFPSKDGGHVSRKTVSNVLSKALRRAGINHRPHQLRAWHATELVDAGVPTIVVSASMRHTDLRSLAHYTRVTDDALRTAGRRLPVVPVPARSHRRAA